MTTLRHRPVVFGSPRVLFVPGQRQTYPVKAWTGGEAPVLTPAVRQARTAFFREQVWDWRRFWGDMPNRDTLSIFLKRATADAYRTLNP